jgi:Leucine-rich repeat (LRR) protein
VQAFDVITQITCLRELKLADNAIEGAVPSTLGLLSQLEVLELQGNKINMLPPEIRELVHLRSLNVSGNRLQALPSELFTSVPLIELIAGKNAFGGSFFDVDAAPQLQILHLGHNSLSSLSASGAVSLPALRYLDVSANRLSTMPDMEAWKSLTTLLAGENKLTTFPEGFTSLQQLRSADFSSNDITKLDEKIALMDGLDILTLAANPIRERKFMSMSAEDIKKDLRSRLVDVATEEEEMEPTGPMPGKENEWELKSPGILDLSSKNLLEVDDATMVQFAATNDVRQLLLPQNYLTAIPMALSHLTSLTLLDLSKNSIMHPLTELLELPKLKELRLPGNKLQSLESITTFLSAPNLQHLDVSNNKIAGSLPNLREKFPDLSRLMAADNALSEVQAESLKGFKIVNLSNNEIARLDPYIGLLQGTLTGFEVEGNTFRVPNHAMIRKGTEAILSWLKDKVPESADGLFLAPEPDGEDY